MGLLHTGETVLDSLTIYGPIVLTICVYLAFWTISIVYRSYDAPQGTQLELAVNVIGGAQTAAGA